MSAEQPGTPENTSVASDPGRLWLSNAKLRRLRPDLFGLVAFLKNLILPVSERRYLAEQLQHGDSRAAVVASIDPLLVAAYTDELDCVAMLRFPDAFAEEYGLTVGSRLLTVNTYGEFPDYQEDLILGPNLIERWTGFHPVIAEFVSNDMGRIIARKTAISEAEWQRTRNLAAEYLASKPGVARDGRPIYAFLPGTKS
jgi:hypothetical protein